MLVRKGDGWWGGDWKAAWKIQRLQLWLVFHSILKQEAPCGPLSPNTIHNRLGQVPSPWRGTENTQGISSV